MQPETLVGQVVRRLWTPFLEDISAGRHIYFTFHREWIEQHLGGLQLGMTSVGLVNHIASQFYGIIGSQVYLKQEVLSPVWNNISATIVLICQQILAVEEMGRDPQGLTEWAYFPRLRLSIDSRLGTISSNPYSSYEDFISIWQRLRAEIIALGGRESSVTFNPGLRKGLNKARYLPFSQALLTKQDVASLVRRIGREVIINADPALLLRKLLAEKLCLSRRGQRMLPLPWMQEALIDQVKSLAKENLPFAREERLLSGLSDRKFSIRVFKDSIDWLNDEFHFALFDNQVNQPATDRAFEVAFIRTMLGRLRYLSLVRDDSNEHWEMSHSTKEVRAGDSLLLIYSIQEFDFVKTLVTRHLGPSEKFSGAPCQLIGLSGVHVQELVCTTDCPTIQIRSGSIYEEAVISERASPGVWAGGIRVENGRFLARYLPHAFVKNGLEYPLNSLVEINETAANWEMFLDACRSVEVATVFRIRFQDGTSTSIGIAGKRSFDLDSVVGFKIGPLGSLGHSAEVLGTRESGVVGYFRFGRGPETTISIGAAAALLSGKYVKGSRMRLSIQEATEKVQFSSLPDAVKRALIAKILQLGGAPVDLVAP